RGLRSEAAAFLTRAPLGSDGGTRLFARSSRQRRASWSLRIALWIPPTSSSLGDVKGVPSLLLSTAARDPVCNGSALTASVRCGGVPSVASALISLGSGPWA